MKINYDKKADAKYITLKKGKISFTKRQEDVLIDYSRQGEIIGLEILNASKNLVNIYTIKGKLMAYEIIKIPHAFKGDNGADIGIATRPSAFIDLFPIEKTDMVIA